MSVFRAAKEIIAVNNLYSLLTTLISHGDEFECCEQGLLKSYCVVA